MANQYARLNDETLTLKLTNTSASLLEDLSPYGVSEEEVLALQDLSADLQTAIALQIAAENFKLAATTGKLAAREDAIQTASNLVAKIYANPEVTDTMLAKIGLAQRPKYARTRPLIPVTSFFAKAFETGEVKLKWNRNGNSASVIFVVEAQTEPDGPFQYIVSTSRTRVTLRNYAPGKRVTFRVFATRTDAKSSPSNVAIIYGDASYSLFAAA